MRRPEKESFVAGIREELINSSVVIVVNRLPGITAEEMTKFRGDVHIAKAKFKILKNTLAKIAVKNSVLEQICGYFEGATGLAYSDDPVGLSKVISTFAKESEKVTVLGGVMNGEPISAGIINELATLPSIDELRAKIVGLLTSVALKIVMTIKEPSARITRVIAARE
ncbi:MAG: 50S ribosomal protein L10 [Holosporales bacterium]|nr:50S ribosomal protein L10 [Holosporales bacterium]